MSITPYQDGEQASVIRTRLNQALTEAFTEDTIASSSDLSDIDGNVNTVAQSISAAGEDFDGENVIFEQRQFDNGAKIQRVTQLSDTSITATRYIDENGTAGSWNAAATGGGGGPAVPSDGGIYGFLNSGSETSARQVIPVTFPDPGYEVDPLGTQFNVLVPQNGFSDGVVQTADLTDATVGAFYGGRVNFIIPDNSYFEIGADGGPADIIMLLVIISGTDVTDPSLSAIQAQFTDRGASTTGTPDGTCLMAGQALNTTSLPSGVNLPFTTGDLRLGFERSGSNVWVHINGSKTLVHDNISSLDTVSMGVAPNPLASPAPTSSTFGVYSGSDTTEEAAFETGVTKLDLTAVQTRPAPLVSVSPNSLEDLSIQQNGSVYELQYTGPVFRASEVRVSHTPTEVTMIPNLGTAINLTATLVQTGQITFEFDCINGTDFVISTHPIDQAVGSAAIQGFARGASTFNSSTGRLQVTIDHYQYSGGSTNRFSGTFYMSIISRIR